MSPDEFQHAWQAESARTRITIDSNALLKAVQRSQHDFRAMNLVHDYLEVVLAILVLPLWFYLGITLALPWTWYLVVIAVVWGIGFILLDRRRHKQRPIEPGESLLNCAKESLAQVEHRIWLRRNTVWWYLLPYAMPIVIFVFHASWLSSQDAVRALASGALLTVFVILLYAFMHYLNRIAIRAHLEPRRQELLALLNDLADETTADVNAEFPILMGATRVPGSRRSMILRGLCAMALLVIGVAGIVYLARRDQEYPKLSPFAAVLWQDSQPEVRVGEEWFQLISLDGIPASDIVAFSQKTYGDKWQKRFEEDLVELLTRMGHPPKDAVTLVLQSRVSSEPQTLQNVPMTSANRQAIRDLSQARDRREQREATHNALSIEGAPAVIAELVPRLRKEKQLVGLAAMLMVDGNVIASAVDGERKKGSGVKLSIGDRWHLGSITKSITATMIARLVEAGQMQWSTTIGECFPDAAIHEDWKPVTIRRLLTHTSGAPANFPFLTPRQRPARGPERTRARHDAVLKVLAKKPDYVPGEKFVYSNAGYTIAGAMAEKMTGATWEDLVEREVFDPLGLAGAGFGPPRSPDKTLDQPRGHSVALGWKLAAADDHDNTPIIGPAGIVHMTLSDLCVYATEHLRGELGEGKLLSAETYKLLHTPELDDYACGWVKKGPGPEIQHLVYWHNGSNTMWYALVVFIPEKKMVVAVTSNDGDIANAEAAAWEIVRTSAHQIDTGSENAPK